MSNKRTLVCTLLLLLLLKETYAAHSRKQLSRRRFLHELNFMHCMCTVGVELRLNRMQCMENFIPPDNTFRMSHSIQYCGYYAYKTNFGQTMRQGISIPDYNPWEYAPDLNTDKSCSYTNIQPHQQKPTIQTVSKKGWVISKCILDMAGMDANAARNMISDILRIKTAGCQKIKSFVRPEMLQFTSGYPEDNNKMCTWDVLCDAL